MNTTTIITGVTTAAGATALCVKKDENKKVTLNKKGLGTVIGVSVGSTITTAIEGGIESCSMNRIYRDYELKNQKTTQAYVDSLSDEELAIALQQLEDLEPTENISEKTR